MKHIIELQNIKGQYADVYVDNICIMTQCYFSVMPKPLAPETQQEAPSNSDLLIKLQHGGFCTADIIKLKKEGMI